MRVPRGSLPEHYPSIDGMNPFDNMTSQHSIWPVLLCMSNLPPWLCTNKKCILMSTLIQGPKQPENDIDIYFKLSVEELTTLWKEGVHVWDAYKKEYFDLRALLLLTIHDLLAYGNTSRQKTWEGKACVTCMDNTASQSLTHSRKAVYTHHHRFLKRNHPYRKMKE